MKDTTLFVILFLISLFAFSQSQRFIEWPQNEFKNSHPFFDFENTNSENSLEFSSNFSHNNKLNDHATDNIEVARSPQEILITKDDKYAIIRCFLGNTIEIVEISTSEIVKSLCVPCPSDFILTNNGENLIVASLKDELFPANPPPDDCSIIGIPLTGQSLLTTIDLQSFEITKTDTVKTWVIRNVLDSTSDSIIYLRGFDIIEYNLKSSQIVRKWDVEGSLKETQIDLKNNKLFLITYDSLIQSYIEAIDLQSGVLQSIQLYPNGEPAYPYWVKIDTLLNRVFIQGKHQPYSEVLVFDALNLNLIKTIPDAFLVRKSFIVSYDLGSIFIGAGFPNNTMELDYFSLELKKILPLPIYSDWHKLIINSDNTRLYSFEYGASQGGGAQWSSLQKLDVVEYDIQNEKFMQFATTDSLYKCSYARDIALTSDDNFLIITNSPDNTISIVNLPLFGINEQTAPQLFNLFPNPVSNKLTISLDQNLNDNYYIAIYNNIGQRILWQSKLETEKVIEIEIDGFYPGQYFISVITSKYSQTLKFIKT